MKRFSTVESSLPPILSPFFLPILGAGFCLIAAGGSAHADLVRIGADATTTFAAGQIGDAGEPSIGGTVNARLLLGQRLSLGVVAGYQRQTLVSTDETAWNQRTQLSSTTVGATARYSLGPLDWTARPFVGLDAGRARFSTDVADFAPYPFSRQSTGLFATPQIGLEANLGHGLAFDFACRYQYLQSRQAVGVGDLTARDLSGAGVAAGLSFAL